MIDSSIFWHAAVDIVSVAPQSEQLVVSIIARFPTGRYNVKLLISPNFKSSNVFLRLILETFDVKTERSYTASLANFEKFLLSQFQSASASY